MQSKNVGYIARLDHLRAFAAFSVLLFHIRLYTASAMPSSILSKVPIINQGHSGVALFMVISGFILARIVGDADIHVGRFFLNRILRIYPLMIFIVALGYFSTPDPRPVSTGVNFMMALLPISNLYRMDYGTYGGALWSIAVELQFYLLFPFLYRQLRTAGWQGTSVLLMVLMLVRCLVYLSSGTVHQLAYFSIFGGLDAFIFGFVAHDVYRSLEGRALPWWLPALVLLAILLLLEVAFRRPGFFHADYNHATSNGISNSSLWIIWPTVQAAAFAALIVTYLRAAPLTRFAPISRCTAWLGKISYSLYVWHIAILVTALPRLQTLQGPYLYVAGIAVVALCVAVAAVSYYTIERPFLSYRMRYLKGAPVPH